MFCFFSKITPKNATNLDGNMIQKKIESNLKKLVLNVLEHT